MVDDFAELEQRQTIDRAQDGMRETPRRFHFEFLIAARAEAGIDGNHDGERQLRFAMEHRDLLRLAVFEDLEVILLQRRYRRATGVGHGGEDVHQLHVHFEGGWLFGLIVDCCCAVAASCREDAATCAGLGLR